MLIRYRLYLGLQIHGLLLSRASPSQLYVKRFIQRQGHNASKVYISMTYFSGESLPVCIPSQTQMPHPTALDGLQSGPSGGYQTSCESAPWGIRWGRARLLRLLAPGPTPSGSMLPCQRWFPIRLAVDGDRPTPIRVGLVLQLDLSVGPGGSGLTRPPPP